MGVLNFFVNEKATLEILDLREIDEVAKKYPPNSDGSPSVSPTTADWNQMGKLADMFEDVGEAMQGDILNKTLNESGLVKFSEVSLSGSKKTFEVQFNPSDLQIEGHGGGRIMTTSAYNNNGSEQDTDSSGNVRMMPVPIHISLNVKLLFDNMNANECFLSAKTNIAPSEVGKSLVRGALNAAGKRSKKSVQQEVEGLIAALRSPYTRCITFNWGDISYTGVLNRVSAQYTMFNSSGEPVRAVVQLSLVCADQKVSAHSLGTWQNAYDGAFGKGSNSLVSWTQRAGNLFNFGK